MWEFLSKASRKLGLTPHELPILLVSLLVAFFVFFVHSLSLRYTTYVDIPFSITSNIEGHANKSSNSEVVSFRVTATGFNLLKINALKEVDASLFIPSDQLTPSGKNLWTISTQSEAFGAALNAAIGEKARLEMIVADNPNFRFPRETHKRVPITAINVTTFEDQYMSTKGLVIRPDSVTVYGDSARLQSVTTVHTKPFRLTKISKSTRGQVKLENLIGVRVTEQAIRYSIDVTRYIQIPYEVEVETINVPKDVTLEVIPPKTTLEIRAVYPLATQDFSSLGYIIDYGEFEKSRDGKCLGELIGALPEGVISAVSKTEVFNCQSYKTEE